MSTFIDIRRAFAPSLRPSLRALLLAGAVTAAGLSAGCGDGKSGGVGGAGGEAALAPGLAVLSNDYTTTSSVSLYTPRSGALVDACVTSGVSSATLTQPLSGNTTLPSQAQTGGKLVVLDGTTSVLTFVDPATCVTTGQLSVATAGFKANPHDIVTLSSTKAYVTRYEMNATPTPDPADLDEGDDLLIVDPTLLTVTGRIPLTPYATPGDDGTPTQARPDRAVLANGLVYVTLNSIDAHFAATGAGRVAIVDPTTDTVVNVIDLPGLKDCSGLSYVADTKKLYVACGGAFGDPDQVGESALVEVILSGPTPVLGRALHAAAIGAGTDTLNFFYAAVLGDSAFVGTLGQYPSMDGSFAGTPDRFYAVSFVTGVSTPLASGGTGELGAPAIDTGTKRVFLPDASAKAPLVHVFDAGGATPVELPGFEPNPSTHLPPRSIAGL